MRSIQNSIGEIVSRQLNDGVKLNNLTNLINQVARQSSIHPRDNLLNGDESEEEAQDSGLLIPNENGYVPLHTFITDKQVS